MENQGRSTEEQGKQQQQHKKPDQDHQVPEMKPINIEAYGGGLYGKDDGETRENKPPASDTQSADGPTEPTMEPKHKPPPSSGDRDIDITGQSYIQ
ncbi:hypothetical protein GIB67_030072 [Kingdonia uniflora]|uniref:Uncharacterized protein n=1 Tax=Kingdonia uniflora TaxID=39325 RepID=A0A7J7MYD3_9MAGN|nr:hypothetical protein GIB67_030072 [Kingdonia uniflora]